uniref:Uncharacterized protein n=1 Tax=Plectus sambesii TaxID=2011161 RepID=A0A914W4H7_9BILA
MERRGDRHLFANTVHSDFLAGQPAPFPSCLVTMSAALMGNGHRVGSSVGPCLSPLGDVAASDGLHVAGVLDGTRLPTFQRAAYIRQTLGSVRVRVECFVSTRGHEQIDGPEIVCSLELGGLEVA